MSEKFPQFNSKSNFFVACGEIYYFSEVAEFLITCNICKNENFENFTKFSEHLIKCFKKFKMNTNKIPMENKNKVVKKDLDLGNISLSDCSNKGTSNSKISSKKKSLQIPVEKITTSIKSIDMPLLQTERAKIQLELRSLQTKITAVDIVNCDKVPEELLEQVLSLEDDRSQQKSQITSSSIQVNSQANNSILVDSLISSTNTTNDIKSKKISSELNASSSFDNCSTFPTTTLQSYFGSVKFSDSELTTSTSCTPILDYKTDNSLDSISSSGLSIITTSTTTTMEQTEINDKNNNNLSELCQKKICDTENVSSNNIVPEIKKNNVDITEDNKLNDCKILKEENKEKLTSTVKNLPYTCDKCQLSFKNVHGWLKHVRSVHNNTTPYACDKCPKSFAQLSRLKVHKRIHTGEKPFNCSYCERTFNQVSHQQRHERTHTGEKPFACKICGKSFTHPESLKAHHTTHADPKTKRKKSIAITKTDEVTGRVLYICSKCKEEFFQMSSLQLHYQKVHLIRKYACKICGKAFNYSSNLTVHRKLHDPDMGKRLKCSFCERLFRQIGHLRRHEQTHTGIKPYKCHICEKTFVEMKDLRYHLQRHSDVRFECDFCPKWYKLEYDLRRHKNRLHMNFESLQAK